MNRCLSLVFLIALICCCPCFVSGQGEQQASRGRIEHLRQFPSRWVPSRNVDIWLPEDYSRQNRYEVLYMHDGQMLFDSTATWNHQSWDVDDVADDLLKKKQVRPFVVVGIWNNGSERHREYFPQKVFEDLSKAEKDSLIGQLAQARIPADYQPVSDAYLRFIVEELKPYIDQHYSVYTDVSHTFIAGSSMGGLISLYAVCEYPAIFGGAACLSTHWPGSFTVINNPIPTALHRYMNRHLPPARHNRIYFDYGDQTLDALYPPLQKQADSIMKVKGYQPADWVTRFFPGKDHSERSWKERFSVPLLFLLSR